MLSAKLLQTISGKTIDEKTLDEVLASTQSQELVTTLTQDVWQSIVIAIDEG
jgi:propanediol dehydratase small subunit